MKVEAYGYPDKAINDSLLTLARALWHNFGPRAAIIVDGDEYQLDPKGDDMGHHPGHDIPVVRRETSASG